MRRFVVALFLITFAVTRTVSAQPTYSKDVAPIFQAKCQQCHRDGDVAPFALKDYDTAVQWGRDIQNVLTTGQMPPWKPVAGYGDFANSRALADADRQTILDWIAAGMPQGDPGDLAAPNALTGEWALGQPDIVLQMAQNFTPPVGSDVYRCFVIPSGLAETTDMSASDVIPGNRQIVHHVIVYQDTTRQALALDGQDGQPGYSCFGGPGIDLSFQTSVLATWAPGQRAQFLPAGIGIQVQKGATLIVQVHYSPSAVTGPDLTRIGFYKAAGQVQQHLFELPIVNDQFVIPPGAGNYVVGATLSVPPLFDAKAINIYPHMHLLGRQIKVDFVAPDKSVQPMIYEDNWDFRWQGAYSYTAPLTLKAGTTVRLTCTYDNSDANPNNPNNPLVPVGWGEATRDEMCIALVGVTFDNEKFLPLNFLRTLTGKVRTTVGGKPGTIH